MPVGPAGALLILTFCGSVLATEPLAAIDATFSSAVRPVLRTYCLACHSAADRQGELDLERFQNLDDVRRDPAAWQKVVEMLDHGEMPPQSARQLSPEDRRVLRDWAGSYLEAEARTNAGDPGLVPLRKLTNAEYTYTIRDLTGVALSPADEFPADGAAGEGFTNAGAAGVMSPALLEKYLEAAKQVAAHAVLTPTGIRWSPSTSRRDWTEETLAEIHRIYARHTAVSDGATVNLQGIVFETNGGGRLPIERYLAAALEERPALRSGTRTIVEIADERMLNARYLQQLWTVLEMDARPTASPLLDALRARWRLATPEQVEELTREITAWQRSLFRFTNVGHIGKVGGPSAWMEPHSPLAERQEIRFPLSVAPGAKEITLYLATSDAGDGNDGDVALWERPRLVAPGRPDLLLRDLRSVSGRLSRRRTELLRSAQQCLDAAAEAMAVDTIEIPALAVKHRVEAEVLSAWLDYLGLGQPAGFGTPISQTLSSTAGYDFIQGWTGAEALSVLANSSDQHVRIPGHMPPRSVAVHPAPGRQVGIAWQCPNALAIELEAAITHAHPECGNGVTWSLEVRRGTSVQRLAAGIAHGGTPIKTGTFTTSLRAGDAVALVIEPRDGNHSCDLTTVDLTIRSPAAVWNLSQDVSPDILAGNPHADGQGRSDVWHFFSEPTAAATAPAIPAGSILAEWQSASDGNQRALRAADLAKLLSDGPVGLPAEAPDAMLYRQITSLTGPLSAPLLQQLTTRPDDETTQDTTIGLDPTLFGRHPEGAAIDAGHLCVRAPSVVEVRIPSELAAGAALVAEVSLHQPTGLDGSMQAQVLTSRPDELSVLQAGPVAETTHRGPWTSSGTRVAHSSPVLVAPGSAARDRFESGFEEFRQLFPPALCYSKIVPVDEVVTLTLFHREDEPLQRLMLSDAETSRLNALWDELHFVSRDALTLVDAYQQLLEFATQDADPKVFEPLRKPILDRAAAFEKQLTDAQPAHIAGMLEFASRAWRRPLTDHDQAGLLALYGKLCSEGLPHEDAVRLTLARVLVALDFLYRMETAPDSDKSGPVSDHALATRLSYFLWSSAPDAELRRLADAGRLHEPEVLQAQTQRMLKDGKVRRLATEFGCQWLQVYNFDQLDEKSEKHFPEFRELRGDMYEEVIQYLTRLFQSDGSIWSLYSSDHAIVNARLARFYGFELEGVELTDSRWQPVNGTERFGRGGVLQMAAVLARQSGASRTSPILRGNWVSEVLLGERLPRPPKDVPPLPDADAASELTVRQLVEKHTSDERCAHCHARIDPYGFTLEGFDAIGRRRNLDLPGLALETTSRLADGTELKGDSGLRTYLVATRRDALLRQFCRKLLGYALGRSVQLSDEPLLAEMKKRLEQDDARVSVAIETIVGSRQFREIRGQGAMAARP